MKNKHVLVTALAVYLLMSFFPQAGLMNFLHKKKA